MVVVEIARKDPPQVPMVQDDDVVQALASDRADNAFHIGILPRRSGRCHDLLNVHGLDRSPEGSAIGAIAVSDDMSRHNVPGKGLPQLLGEPQGRGMGRDPEMHDPAPLMGSTMKTKSTAKVTVGTVKKSIDAKHPTWFPRNVRQV